MPAAPGGFQSRDTSPVSRYSYMAFVQAGGCRGSIHLPVRALVPGSERTGATVEPRSRRSASSLSAGRLATASRTRCPREKIRPRTPVRAEAATTGVPVDSQPPPNRTTMQATRQASPHTQTPPNRRVARAMPPVMEFFISVQLIPGMNRITPPRLKKSKVTF